MKRILLALVFPAMIWAQSKPAVSPAPEPNREVRLIHLNYAVASQVADLLRPEGFNINAQNGLHAVVVEGPPAEIERAEQIIKELDRPSPSETARGKDVEVTISLIGATTKTESAHNLPPDLAGVAKQLHEIFPYTDYRLLDRAVLVSRIGNGSSAGSFMPDFPEPNPNNRKSQYSIAYKIVPDLSSTSPEILKFEELTFEGELPWGNVRLRTDLDMRDGQKVVVSKTTVDNDDSAIFLVLSAKELH
jgi:hypothetical protein